MAAISGEANLPLTVVAQGTGDVASGAFCAALHVVCDVALSAVADGHLVLPSVLRSSNKQAGLVGGHSIVRTWTCMFTHI